MNPQKSEYGCDYDKSATYVAILSLLGLIYLYTELCTITLIEHT